jgi:SAM-dependent methyltransferase
MTDQPEIRFDDGAAYERMMGIWSRSAGEVFLDWLQPASGLAWADIGCGNGAFSALLFDRVAPARLSGIDPSEAQLAYARERLLERPVEFQRGDAMALPFADGSFDAAAMALVIFFVPDPAKGVAEMARIVRPGGLVASYGWDMLGGGLPMAPIQSALREMGLNPPLPPSPGASGIESLQQLWRGAGLTDIETREIAVERRFDSLDDYWSVYSTGALGPTFAALTATQADDLRARLRASLRFDAAGGVLCSARANAVRGRVPV